MPTIVEKEYYYNRSVDVLIDAMNAKRKAVLADILTGLAQPTMEGYSIGVAWSQLRAYYEAGSIDRALQFITVQADAHEKVSDARIKAIPIVTKTTLAQVDSTERLTDAINATINPALTAENARAALTLLGDDLATLPTTLPPLQLLLSKKIKATPFLPPDKKNEELQRITDAFLKVGILQ